MPYSYVLYTGNGTTTNYTFPFPYLEENDIKVRVNGTLTAYTFLNSSTVTISPAPASGAIIEIRRETISDTAPVDFTDGSVLLERDLDLMARYNLYVSQETADVNETNLGQDAFGNLDAEDRRIVNLATPTADGDAVNKEYADAIIQQSADAATAAGAIQVGLASTQASNASASALAAASSATNALASANTAAASYDSFDDRYLGAKAVAPTLDNDGNALLTGAIYWDTASNEMFVWNGASWGKTFVTGSVARSVVTATAGQTVVPTPTYTIGANTLQVFVNGAKLLVTADYTETSQSSITMASGLAVGDEVELIAVQPFAIGTTGASSVSFQQTGSMTVRTVD